MGLDPRYRGSTVKLYVSALRKYELDHATVGLPLHSPRITAIVEGIRRKKGVENDGAPTPKKKGLTIDMLVQIEAQALDQGTLRTFEDKLFFAATTVGVAGLFRSGDYIDCGGTQHKSSIMRVGDVSFFSSAQPNSSLTVVEALRLPDRVHHILIRLRRSKTDQRSVGTDVYIMGVPVRALMDYLSCFRETRGVYETLFIDRYGANLTKVTLVGMLREKLEAVGMEKEEARKFAGHCFRRGGAKHLDHHGNDVVKIAGRWDSEAHCAYHDDVEAKLKAAELAGQPSWVGRGDLGGEGIGVMNKFNSSNTNTEITQQQETKRKTKKPQNKKRTKKASSSSIPSSGDGASLRQINSISRKR